MRIMSQSSQFVLEAFCYGGLSKTYPGAVASTCEKLDPRASWKMRTLGSILLHEFTHYGNLVAPLVGASTDDLAYGPYSCHRMDKTNALHNSDSHAWMALEYY
jgi:hypothetical protein